MRFHRVPSGQGRIEETSGRSPVRFGKPGRVRSRIGTVASFPLRLNRLSLSITGFLGCLFCLAWNVLVNHPQPEQPPDRFGFGRPATAGIALLKTAVGQTIRKTGHPLTTPAETHPGSARQPPLPDPIHTPGPPPSPIGTRSGFETLKLIPSDTSSRTPLQSLYGIITPSDLHFQRHHAGVPTIDPDKYQLLIHGMVERPTVFTLKDLKRFPALSRICFLECAGNFRSGKPGLTPQEICGLTSQAEFTGVLLSTLFREVGVDPKATWFLAEGSDAAVLTRSIPIHKAWNDAMIAYGQNGEALRPEQGYPARLLLPGWEGNMNVKYSQFNFLIDARSIITSPCYPNTIEKGWIEIRGLAWSGRGRIAGVDISTDAGRSWHPANLNGPILDKAHTRFTYLWKWDGAETEIPILAAIISILSPHGISKKTAKYFLNRKS
jgi:sulfane dehydrogenase subunit SoxC